MQHPGGCYAMLVFKYHLLSAQCFLNFAAINMPSELQLPSFANFYAELATSEEPELYVDWSAIIDDVLRSLSPEYVLHSRYRESMLIMVMIKDLPYAATRSTSVFSRSVA